jgi:aminopeptidase N
MAHDSDAFNRWEAGQVLAARIILAGAEALRAGKPMEVPPAYVEAIGRVLANASRDPAFAAECLTLPPETFLAEQMQVADPDLITRRASACAARWPSATARASRAPSATSR